MIPLIQTSRTGKSVRDRTDWYLRLRVGELGGNGEGVTVKGFGVIFLGWLNCCKIDCNGSTTLWI